ncbi:MAG TPA: hypothetical protein VF796_17835 [Humisphaera sp.]
MNRTRRTTARAASPMVEPLEGRQLFSAALPVAPAVDAGGVLQVMGTRKSDVIVVSVSAAGATDPATGTAFAAGFVTVTVNGVLSSAFDRAAVTGGVRVVGGNGNDTITVTEELGATAVDVTMLGGNGKDALTGGSGKDVLDGGNGNDVLAGMLGDDMLRGGNGKDTLDGGDGADDLDGGKGKDTVTGGLGADVFGGKSKDELVTDLEAGETGPTVPELKHHGKGGSDGGGGSDDGPDHT